MDIHVVRAGETVSSVAARYGVPAGILAGVNGVAPDAPLAVGQTLVVRHPRELHTVASGESVYSIALHYGLSVRTLYQNNPALGGRSALYPGQTLVIAYDDAPLRTLAVNAYSYPFIRGGLLDAALPYLTYLTPFTYGINLLRETVGGMYSFNYLFNLCILGVFLIVALFIGLQLRPLLLNLNLLFDKQLSTTGMMICESNDLPRQRYSLRTAMRVMLDSDSYRRELLDHAVAFEHRYPYYIKGGFAAVVGVQVLLFVLSTVLDIDNNGKIILLVIWIISVIAICGWLINIEYIRASLNTQMRISALSDEDLRREMREHTAAIPAARHMFGLNASERGAKGGDQSTGRLPHIGSHHKSQGSDSTATNDGDTTALGKHSKGGEA